MKNLYKRTMGIILILILLSSNVAFAVSQSDINNSKQQQQENNNKIKETQAQKEEVSEAKDETQKQVEELNTKITDYQGQISTLNAQINDTNAQISQQESDLAQAEKDYTEQQELIKKRMVAVYTSGDTSYLDFLLSSKDLSDFISSYYLVSEVTQMDTDLLDKIDKQKQDIENSKKQLEESKNNLTKSKAEKESVNQELTQAKAEKATKVSQLSAQEQQLQSQIEELQKDNVQIDQDIANMQAVIKKAQEEAARKAQEEAAKKAAESKKNNSKNSGKSSGSSSNNSGSTSGTSSAGFIRPVNSSITTGMYYSSGSYHGAVDFGASGVAGMPVYAVADGIVVTTKALTTSYGNYIILYHPSSNLYTLYAHGQAGSIAVSVGQSVKQGQQIMRVGSTGNSTGPHLHFEVRTSPGYYSNRTNPMNYLP